MSLRDAMTAQTRKSKNQPTWTNLKHSLIDMDRGGLLGLIQDLYAASKDNQAFLHARFGLGQDVLKPYKAVISRGVCPDVLGDQHFSVSRAKKAIADYKKAIGRPEGLAELAVFYCEECVLFLGFCGVDDEGYFDALVRMFEQALKAAAQIEPILQASLLERLERIRQKGHNYGYGVGDDMDGLMSEYGFGEK